MSVSSLPEIKSVIYNIHIISYYIISMSQPQASDSNQNLNDQCETKWSSKLSLVSGPILNDS